MSIAEKLRKNPVGSRPQTLTELITLEKNGGSLADEVSQFLAEQAALRLVVDEPSLASKIAERESVDAAKKLLEQTRQQDLFTLAENTGTNVFARHALNERLTAMREQPAPAPVVEPTQATNRVKGLLERAQAIFDKTMASGRRRGAHRTPRRLAPAMG